MRPIKIKNDIINFGSKEYYRNKDIVKKICGYMNLNFKKNVKFISDRPFNDYRYKVSFNKAMKYGWNPKSKFDTKIRARILVMNFI